MNGGAARDPILDAVVELVAAEGYANVTMTRVLRHAGTHDTDFDDRFPDVESAMFAALDAAAERAIRRIRRVAAQAMRELPVRSQTKGVERVFEPALHALLECAAAAPAVTRVCVIEVMTVGERGLARRDAALERFVQLLETALPDLPERPSQLASEMVVGGIYELLQRRVRTGRIDSLPELAPALTAIWLPVLSGAS